MTYWINRQPGEHPGQLPLPGFKFKEEPVPEHDDEEEMKRLSDTPVGQLIVNTLGYTALVLVSRLVRSERANLGLLTEEEREFALHAEQFAENPKTSALMKEVADFIEKYDSIKRIKAMRQCHSILTNYYDEQNSEDD